jgi:hypothetical protein
MGALRDELRGEMASLGDGLRGEMGALRDELRGEMASLGDGLRGEMGALRDELRGEMASQGSGLRGEMTSLGDGLRGEMNARFERMDERFDALQRTMLQLGGAAIVGLMGVIATLIATRI